MKHKAIIQGEIHTGQRDSRNLFDRRTEETAALMTEGRSSTIQFENQSVGYILFLIGYLSLELIYQFTRIFNRLFPGRATWDIETAAKKNGLQVHSEIDAELHEIWELTENNGRKKLYLVPILTMLFGIFHGFTNQSVYLIPDSLFPVIAVAGSPFLFTGVVIFSLIRNEERDEIMANSIIKICEQEDLTEVLILCGDKHVSGICERLEEKGWEVDKERSAHPLGRINRLM